MLKKCSFMVLLIALSLALLGLPPMSRAQDAESIDPSAFTTGIIAPDGFVNYSVIVMTGTDALTDVAISLTLPEGATFVDVFKTPKNAALIGQQDDGSIAWTVAEIPAETTIGPFTVIAEFEDQAEEDFAPPAGASATVVSGDTTLDAIVPEGTLTRLADSGSITLDAAGTGGEFVQIGETGVWILMQPDTVSEPVTLTFTRVPITDDTDLPTVAEDTWWCTLYNIAIEPADVEFADLPLAILFPTRRTVTPGLPAIEFTQDADNGEWTVLAEPVAGLTENRFARPNFDAPPKAVALGSGNYLLSYHSGGTLQPAQPNSPGINYAGGYVEQDNILAQVTNGYINAYNQLVTPLTTLPGLVAGPPARR